MINLLVLPKKIDDLIAEQVPRFGIVKEKNKRMPLYYY